MLWECGRPLGPAAPPTTSHAASIHIKKLIFSFFRSLSTKSGLREHETAEMGEAGETEVVSRTVARSQPSTHAGGQDDGSYTNSLKLCKMKLVVEAGGEGRGGAVALQC